MPLWELARPKGAGRAGTSHTRQEPKAVCRWIPLCWGGVGGRLLFYSIFN